MKNYYEILEVDQKASQEIIEKAYRILVKRYHPDLQGNEYEKEMKEINEAYAVLSDEYKRNQYDEQLQAETIPILEYEKIKKENVVLRNKLQKLTTSFQQNTQSNVEVNIVDRKKPQQVGNTFSNMGKVFYNEVKRTTKPNNNTYNQQYSQEYVQNKEQKDIKYYLKLAGYIIVTIIILILIYQIPIVKRFFTNMYKENIVFKAIVDVFKNTFTTKF